MGPRLLTAAWKRLEALEKAVRFRHPRIIVITVPTVPDGSGVRTPETETALAEIKRQHAIMDDDLVLRITPTTRCSLPQLVSITQQS